MVHAQINDVSRILVTGILSELMIDIAYHLLLAFKRVDIFSPAGMLQAAMETEFLHHALISYETEISKKAFTCVYEFIESNVDKESVQNSSEDGSMTIMLQNVRHLLNEVKSDTRSLFLCFREANWVDPDLLKSKSRELRP